jgi:TPP-dependent pyruvate/acetoin dehydrogenase alpha subunit
VDGNDVIAVRHVVERALEKRASRGAYIGGDYLPA